MLVPTDDRMTEAEALVVTVIAESIQNMAKAEEWLAAMRERRDMAVNVLRTEHQWTITDCADLTGLTTTTIYKVGLRAGLKSVRKAVRE